MSRVISRSSIQLLLNKIQSFELQYFLYARKLEHLKNQLDFAQLCYKRELLSLSDQESQEFDKLSKKIEEYQEVEIQ